MKRLSFAGIVLMLLGVLGLAHQGSTYSQRRTLAHAVASQASKNTKETLPAPPIHDGVIYGGAAIGGIALLIAGIRSAFNQTGQN